MATGSRTVSDVLRIMRRAISRQNRNDSNSSDTELLRYINDFISLSMSNDLRIVEQFSTLTFNIGVTPTTGVYTFNAVGASSDFVSISDEAFISLLDPQGESVSWSELAIYRDPGEFFSVWGINNDDILIAGYPTAMLFYGNEMTFRTIPDDDYMVKIYGYKKNNDFATTGDPPLQFDYWLRYVAYGASVNYASDFGFSSEKMGQLEKEFAKERRLMLAHTHNEIKHNRCIPRF